MNGVEAARKLTSSTTSGELSGNTKDIKEVLTLINNSDIASIKSVLSGILGVINNPESSAKDLTDLVETDPPLEEPSQLREIFLEGQYRCLSVDDLPE